MKFLYLNFYFSYSGVANVHINQFQILAVINIRYSMVIIICTWEKTPRETMVKRKRRVVAGGSLRFFKNLFTTSTCDLFSSLYVVIPKTAYIPWSSTHSLSISFVINAIRNGRILGRQINEELHIQTDKHGQRDRKTDREIDR